MATTHTCEPKCLAISSISAGFFRAEELIETLSAPGVQQTVDIAHLVDTPSYREGNTHMGGHTAHQVGKCLAPLVRRRNVEIYQLIGTLLAVCTAQLYGVAGISEIDKIHSFDGLSVFYIKAGNDSFC